MVSWFRLNIVRPSYSLFFGDETLMEVDMWLLWWLGPVGLKDLLWAFSVYSSLPQRSIYWGFSILYNPFFILQDQPDMPSRMTKTYKHNNIHKLSYHPILLDHLSWRIFFLSCENFWPNNCTNMLGFCYYIIGRHYFDSKMVWCMLIKLLLTSFIYFFIYQSIVI